MCFFFYNGSYCEWEGKNKRLNIWCCQNISFWMISKGLQKVWTLLNLRSLQFRAIFTGTVSKLFHASSCFLEQAIAQTTYRILVSRLYSLSFLHSLLIGSTDSFCNSFWPLFECAPHATQWSVQWTVYCSWIFILGCGVTQEEKRNILLPPRLSSLKK